MKAVRRRGMTLVECAVVCAVVAVLAGVALPSLRGHELAAGRWDAVQALMKLQAAQEQYRSAHGLYASDLSALRGVAAHSGQGRYAIALVRTGGSSYTATAAAVGSQRADRTCMALTLSVESGFARTGPNPPCWKR